MYSKLIIPVDLKHVDQMDKALSVSAEIGKLFGATLHIVGVTSTAPSETARTPDAFNEKLTAYANEKSEAFGAIFEAHTEVSHDPSVDLDDVLQKAAKTIGADLIVMASHIPGFAEHFVSSNAGYVASHSPISVFVVR
tara:strand:- start:10147 stop:10560 length:414 start_codon:yes stop_codon:yes gene_type:complete